MSTRIEIDSNGIKLSAFHRVDFTDMAAAFAAASSSRQAQFLKHLAIILSGTDWSPGSWAMQCRYIAEEDCWAPDCRKRAIDLLETLLEHLRDVQSNAAEAIPNG